MADKEEMWNKSRCLRRQHLVGHQQQGHQPARLLPPDLHQPSTPQIDSPLRRVHHLATAHPAQVGSASLLRNPLPRRTFQSMARRVKTQALARDREHQRRTV